MDTFLTVPEEWCVRQRIDYILECRITDDPQQQTGDRDDEEISLIRVNNKDKFSNLEVMPGSTKIEPHFTEQYDDQPGVYKQPFPQISDHYGVSTIITIK